MKNDIKHGRLVWKEIIKHREQYAMVLPFALLFTIFTIIPVLVAIVLSFTYYNLLEPPRFIGLDNYIRLLIDDDIFLISLKNTLIFAFITGPISYIASILFAWMINELPAKLRAFMTLIFYAPSISGSLYVIWIFIFNGDVYGFLNSQLMNLGLISEPVQWLTDTKYTLMVVIVVQLWLSLGTGFLAMIAGLKGVDRSLYEAAAIDGIKNRFQELIKITLPSIGSSMLFSAVMTISTSFAAGAISVGLVGFPSTDYSASTIITHIMDYGNLRYEMGYASAVATVLFLMMLGTNQLVKKLLGKYTA